MAEFELKRDEDGEIVGCECCGYEAATSEFPGAAGSSVPSALLCEICSHTHLSVAIFYPGQTWEPLLYKSIGWIANRLLDEIRKTAK